MTHEPDAISRPVPSHGGPMSAHLGLVMHTTTNHFDPYGFFHDPVHQASSTWWVSDAGLLEEFVAPDLRAWAQGAGNSTYNSVEFSGNVDEPLTPAQIETAAHLYAWGHGEYRWPFQLSNAVGVSGFGWHGMGAKVGWGHPFCPGEIRKAQRPAILARAAELVTHHAPAPVPAPPVAVVHPAPDRLLGLTTPLMHGLDVKNVQHALNVYGNSIDESGVYDRTTADALQEFKNDKGITEAGCGPLTWAALRAVVHPRPIAA